MAIGYSTNGIDKRYHSPQTLSLAIRIRCFVLIEVWRKLARKLLQSTSIQLNDIPPCAITANLEAATPTFRLQRWALVENIFNAEFHLFLKQHWPERRYFTAPFDSHKVYDKGFRWVDRNPGNDRWQSLQATDMGVNKEGYPSMMSQFPQLRVVFDYLRSADFIKRLNRFSDRPEPLLFNRFQLTNTYPGSYVALHRESPQNSKNWLSLIFHIDGSGGPDSGGLVIAAGNHFDSQLYETLNLSNTCLAFDPAAAFYHGVKPIADRKFRHMFSAEYVSHD